MNLGEFVSYVAESEHGATNLRTFKEAIDFFDSDKWKLGLEEVISSKRKN